MGDIRFVGEPGPCIGGNSPSSSNKKHCFGGVSVATAISWNFSESADNGDDGKCNRLNHHNPNNGDANVVDIKGGKNENILLAT